MRRHLLTSCATAVAFVGFPSAPHAETLVEALTDAYNGNPQILAERALLRATDEGVSQALSGWRRTVQFTGSVGKQHVENRPSAPPVSPGMRAWYRGPSISTSRSRCMRAVAPWR